MKFKNLSKKQIRNIALVALLCLVLLVTLIKLESDWRKREALRTQLLAETTPQVERMHKIFAPYLKQLETQAVWKDKELLLIYRVELPDYLKKWFEDIIEGTLVMTDPETVDELYVAITMQMEFMVEMYEPKVKSDIDHRLTMQVVSEQGNVLLWVNNSEVISSVIPDLSQSDNLGSIDYTDYSDYTTPKVGAGTPVVTETHEEFTLLKEDN